ncbi:MULTISPECIES: GHMP kinase [Rhizobium]|uniref:GHMP kinase n=1 Tax=Rhizobium indicum TaxID=2583231 RepID=A0ABX6PSP7_9HYPH|nr:MULTISPECIES: GHMP kinase [Rhizobium]NYT33363.1 GHMP kinase [Rhizobium sp. WYCCWR 11128]QKK21630.1 GHMP kinase [Rhizobium indicum]
MIVSSAPFRVSFAGGGSDIASYYRRQAGAVLSCAIAKYSFVIVHNYFNENKYHLKYTRTELADTLEEIAHPLLREALRMHRVEPGIEVASVADIPSGTGLGSSSSFSVALINALYAHRSRFASKDQLAEEACKLEIDILKEPIGKQDQYAAAHGGLNFIEFNPNGGVNVQPVVLGSEKMAELESNILLFFTGSQRDTRSVLSTQVQAMEADEEKFRTVERMVQLSYEMRDILMAGDLSAFGEALHRGWMMKRSLTSKITNNAIDECYEAARAAGAIGGKLAGAGGGGFLVLYCPRDRQEKVRQALSQLKEIEFRFDWSGARIAFAQ